MPGHRAQTKGKVERSLRYVGDNFLPGARPTDLDSSTARPCNGEYSLADQRIHATPH